MPKVIRFDEGTHTCDEAPTLLQWGRDVYEDVAHQHGLNPDTYIEPEMNKIYGIRSLFDQLIPVRDVLPGLWRLPRGDDSRAVTVISTHTSKSVRLPVYQLMVPGVGVFRMRNNFYDWGVSCDLAFPAPNDLWGDMFNPAKIGSFFEGFDASWVYEPFAVNQQRFSLMISSNFEQLYAFMFVLRLHAIKLGLTEPRTFR